MTERTAAGARTPMDREFFDRPVLEVAPDLLGRVLSRTTPEGTVAVRLTEVEAYAGEQDPASHCYRGRTARNEVMFGEPGHAYVYFTYGMHFCVNLVCGPDGTASAVLLRAGEIIEGAEQARIRRNGSSDRDLARGPARLCQALGIERALNGADVCAPGELTISAGTPVPAGLVRSGPRTGVSSAHDTPWRFWAEGEPSVSPYRRHTPRRRG
ncbi:DNA-3-methyladenine glycosylase [Actinocorallia aurantiaca]|uniref:Putative 3-methyladenine DNA glycosylase n=1 Tax=Actinocorallia aurantiaca TaxID=46204 RepID=A0ABN3UFI8_9ACTN